LTLDSKVKGSALNAVIGLRGHLNTFVSLNLCRTVLKMNKKVDVALYFLKVTENTFQMKNSNLVSCMLSKYC